MSEWTDIDTSLLKEHYRPIVHMRKQFAAGKLVLVFGTGLTQPVNIPDWNRLNDMIAGDPRVQGTRMLGRPTKDTVQEFLENESREPLAAFFRGAGPEETVTTQKLFEHFKRKKYGEKPPQEYYDPKLDAEVHRDWKDIIRAQLYKEATDEKEILEKHTYLSSFLPIIRNTPLTITYNYDDVIESALIYGGSKREQGRPYEIATDIRILPRRKSAVIYHPNGYIPRNPLEEKTQEIVLSESEFADRMIELTSGQYNSLLHILSRNTCLFIGLSLRDSILKNLLKQSALIAPGNYHYYVHYCPDGKRPCIEETKSIQATNFDTYSLVTLCLNDNQLSSIGKMISCGYHEEKAEWNDDPFRDLTEKAKIPDTDLCFYIVGAIGAGKSTCVSHLRSLVTHDEWLEDRLPMLADNWRILETPDRRTDKEKTDLWIAGQFKEKNAELIKTRFSISVCDRCPLDPVTFTPPKEWRLKAALLLKTICEEPTLPIRPGHVIVLWHDPEHLEIRVRRTAKKYDRAALEWLQKCIEIIYEMPGVTFIDCRFLSFHEIMKRVCRIVHMDDYRPADIQRRLVDIEKGIVTQNGLFLS
jgi:hypothetical protein